MIGHGSPRILENREAHDVRQFRSSHDLVSVRKNAEIFTYSANRHDSAIL